MTQKDMDIHEVSFFKAPVTNKYPYQPLSLANVWAYIIGTKAEERTKKLRAITDKKEAKVFKGKNFDFVTSSGLFSYHSDKSLIRHSGLICIDFDHIADIHALKTTLLHDPYFATELMFRSPSGDGLKWWVPIDIAKHSHREWFQAMRNYLHATYGLEADPACINESRACFLPFDPDCVVNPLICPF